MWSSFVAAIRENLAPANRPKLWFAIWTGFAIDIGLAVLAAAAAFFELTPWKWAYITLVSVKLLTNSIAWLALSNDKWVLATQALNLTADVVLLTAAIYFTGGPYSPLVSTYVIVIAALALLSNLAVTVMLATGIVLAFSSMMAMMAIGILPPTVVPGAPGQVPSVGYTLTAIGYVALVVGVPAWFSSATLRLLRKKELDLERRTAELIQAAAQRSQFVASMTHELRTPIHGVQGLSDVIAAGVYGPVTDKQKEACASIKRSAQSLLQLVDDVLQLTRAEAGKIDARPGRVDVAELVERVTASVSWMVGTKKLNLDVDLEPNLPSVQSDERWLAHVLVNLIANAVKFTPEGGRVTVRAQRVPDGVELAVEDTGIGIAPEDREKIFEPFRQGEHGDTKGFGGVGLGLALVAQLSDLLALQLSLESTVNKGSTFKITVPLVWRGRKTKQIQVPVVVDDLPS
ncbi:MAG: HAMP domain-containing histidine kinase [Deltaproteobacteria bacterium]|nr:HAMP domain-containing histidine kinase [Deltaproteobacteria bacterium]